MKRLAPFTLLLAACAATDPQPEKPMSHDAKHVMSSFVAEVFNAGDLAAADRYFAPAFVDHAPWPDQPATVEGFKAGLRDFRAAFPDFRVDVQRVVVEGDTAVGHFTMSGTQLGPFMGAPPTGKTIRVEAIDIVRLDDGLIVEHWGLIDTAAMAAQLGLAP